MTDETPYEETEYIPDPEKEKQAKAVHFTVSIIRLLGVVILMLGIAIAVGKLPPVPTPAGYVLIIIALIQMWVFPLWMVRSYVKAQAAQAAEEETAKKAEKDGTDETVL